jgi:molecular chaperone GrpE (heat shock protein)
MTIQAKRHNDLPEQEHGNDGERAGETPHSLACLSTFAPTTVLFHQLVYAQLGRLGERVQELEKRLEHLNTILQEQSRQYDEHVATLAACQKETADVLNHKLERHALYPAVEAVVALAAELSRLEGQARQLLPDSADGDQANKLLQELDISCRLAAEKLAHLDVAMITPDEKENFDPQAHTVCSFIETTDKRLHKRIAKIVTPGILYQGKVLRPARVSVFRLQTSNQPH